MKRRLIFGCALIVALICLCLYSYFNFEQKQYFSLTSYYSSPSKFQGKEDIIYGESRGSAADGFYLYSDGKTIEAVGEQVPDYAPLVVQGKFSEGKFLIEKLDVQEHNWFKYLISLGAIPIILLFFFREWKFSWWGFKDA